MFSHSGQSEFKVTRPGSTNLEFRESDYARVFKLGRYDRVIWKKKKYIVNEKQQLSSKIDSSKVAVAALKHSGVEFGIAWGPNISSDRNRM